MVDCPLGFPLTPPKKVSNKKANAFLARGVFLGEQVWGHKDRVDPQASALELASRLHGEISDHFPLEHLIRIFLKDSPPPPPPNSDVPSGFPLAATKEKEVFL